MPVFQVALDEDGFSEPGFCSVCHLWQTIIVFFLTDRMEVAACGQCIKVLYGLVTETEQRNGTAEP